MSTRILGLGFVIVGSILVLFGIDASHSVVDSVKQDLTGRFTDKTMWYLIGGIALVVWGAALALRGGRGTRSP